MLEPVLKAEARSFLRKVVEQSSSVSSVVLQLLSIQQQFHWLSSLIEFQTESFRWIMLKFAVLNLAGDQAIQRSLPTVQIYQKKPIFFMRKLSSQHPFESAKCSGTVSVRRRPPQTSPRSVNRSCFDSQRILLCLTELDCHC